MEILKLLRRESLCVSDLVFRLKLPQPKVSLLLKELRDLKLILVGVEGKKRYYSINFAVLDKYIVDIKKIISDFDVNSSNEIIVRRKVLLSN